MAVEDTIKQFISAATSKVTSAVVDTVSPTAFLGNLAAQADQLEGLSKKLHPNFSFDGLKTLLAKRFENGITFDELLDIVTECGDDPIAFVKREVGGLEGGGLIIDKLKDLSGDGKEVSALSEEVGNA